MPSRQTSGGMIKIFEAVFLNPSFNPDVQDEVGRKSVERLKDIPPWEELGRFGKVVEGRYR